ncbi:hypothetical protein GCM10019059_35520 [Camelimonas fluminis]|uniref:site-specific DNA-methyltransferase (adenine-specific) n=1 Tax=Camelimonas fluminis TaxID=1576911 RepID=A0ABV7UFU9_9HYPH|nr:hypothetical protein [Camelimonas fluminis]GHE72832.1 hypothetical protein GCM10019059_35520 [Camelimonas fluminis]
MSHAAAPESKPTIEAPIFSYAANIVPARKISTLIIGATSGPGQQLVAAALGTDRAGDFRHIISLKGYAHGNTKRPADGSVDLLVADARGSKRDSIEALFHLAQECLAPRGRSAWVFPPDFVDSVDFAAIRSSLGSKYTVTHIHQNDDKDGHVRSDVIVWVGNAAPRLSQMVVASRGGPTDNPTYLADHPITSIRTNHSWETLLPHEPVAPALPSDALATHFDIEEGIDTGNDDLFILTHSEIMRRGLETDLFRAVLPRPHTLEDEVIESRPGGFPNVSQRSLMLQTNLSPEDIKSQYPNVHAYLTEAEAAGLAANPAFTNREYWYALPERPSPPILCAANPGEPCCFFLNLSKAVATNEYLSFYPKPHLASAIARNQLLLSQVWNLLNQTIETMSEDLMLERASTLVVPGLSDLLSN